MFAKLKCPDALHPVVRLGLDPRRVRFKNP
jgi:hypothetical protein